MFILEPSCQKARKRCGRKSDPVPWMGSAIPFPKAIAWGAAIAAPLCERQGEGKESRGPSKPAQSYSRAAYVGCAAFGNLPAEVTFMSIAFEIRHGARKEAMLLRKRDALIAAGLAYYKAGNGDCSISITEFVARPAKPTLSIEHIHAFRAWEASQAEVRTFCEPGRQLKAGKWWQSDYRTGKRGW